MATHTGIPTWKIPWTEEPGGLQSTTDHTCTCTRTHQLSHGHWKNSPFSDCFKMVLLLPIPFDLQWLCFWVGHSPQWPSSIASQTLHHISYGSLMIQHLTRLVPAPHHSCFSNFSQLFCLFITKSILELRFKKNYLKNCAEIT